MGTEFCAPAVGRFMEIVRAWALHPWPMTRAQGIATYKALGWVRADDDIESFTTDCTAGEAESFFYASRGLVRMVDVQISSLMPPAAYGGFDSVIAGTYRAYCDEIARNWGEPVNEKDQGTGRSATWILPNDACLSLSGNRAGIGMIVAPPDQTEEYLTELRTGTSIFDDPEALP